MSTDFDKLNRLRVNAGKPELKSWKASKEALIEQISKFEKEGFTDALPGANIKAEPVPPPDLPDIPSLADSAMAKNVDKSPQVKEERKATVVKAKLARGLETDQMARQSRAAVASQRFKEKKEEKEQREVTKKADKKSKKKERKISGKIDEKADPEGAKRQLQHIKDKQEARARKPKTEKSADEVTAADVCRELDIDPKIGRAKLRRHEAKLPSRIKGKESSWTFPKSAHKIISDILKGVK